jgi:anti-sigma factor RsiW
MNCDWTEKISLLIDGELGPDETRAAEGHLADCASCRQAREDFLLLRRQINSYTAATDRAAQRQALRKILGVEAGVAGARDASLSGVSPSGFVERLGGVFALPRLSPALGAAFAVLLVAVVIGVVLLRSRESVEVAANPNRGANAGENANAHNNLNTNAVVAPSPSATPNESASSRAEQGSAPEKNRAVESGVVKSRKGDGLRVETASNGGTKRGANLNAGARREQEARRPKIIDRLKLPVAPKLAVDSAELAETEIAALRSKVETTDSDTSRHVEQAQRLLRSFRNARGEGEASAEDVAYEKRRSRELLYRNIVLRREAAAKGDESVASLLDSLEPILIDIANLPDRPAQTDVRAITERMRKKNIVAMLQVANGSRMY